MIDKNQAAQKGIKILERDSNPLEEMLKTHFPQSIREGQVNLNAIAALLGKDISNIQGYELTFTGKGLANALYTTPCQKVLKHKETFCHSKSQNEVFLENAESLSDSKILDEKCGLQEEAQGSLVSLNDRSASSPLPHLSLKDESQKNTLIIGDNLDALKLLKSAYSEKIKMIYIDPPYNTGNDDFIYPDDFRADYKAILREVGLLEIDENENEVESETLQFFRNITGSKSHSGWLCFMLPRLKLARDLLKDEGVIFISIDDNEQANLKLLCDEIFGEENFVAQIVWKQFHSVKNDANNFSKNTEYILCYSKNVVKNIIHNEIFDKKDSYKLDDKNGKGLYKLDPVWAKSGTNAETYIFKNGKSWRPPSGTFWRYSIETLKQMEMKNEIVFNGKNPMAKRYLNQVSEGRKSSTFWDGKEVGYTLNGDAEVKNIFDNNKIFENPKPVNLIKRILQISTSADSNDIVLDFFAGSGTTAQAVMELNAEDKGNRECILVQLDEPINQEKSKTAYDFCKNELKSKRPTISDITMERVKRAAKKINANVCLNIFTLESKPKLISDKKGTLALTTNTNLSALDKAINLALSAGKTLSQTLQVVIEDKLYKCEDSYFCIECDKKVLEELSKTSDEYIYLDGFAGINLEHFLNLDAQFKERLNIVY
ncbi:site-specific DNA-methyltransferase [Helicobacter ganmani]|uniref:site-specific DNA-methyltransferase n=2 Tax=Helicobacter TaxID=209 RepID=UPI003A8382D6